MTALIVPVTDFRKDARNILENLRETAVVLTQRSRPVAVIVDYSIYYAQQKRLDELELALDDHLLNHAIETASEFVSMDDLFAEIESSKGENLE